MTPQIASMRFDLILGLLMITTAAVASAPDLSAHLGMDRVLLAFAGSERDEALSAQRAELARFAAGMTERDLVLLVVVGSGAGEQALRTRYGVSGDGFTVLLIGKDGGVKLRSARPLSMVTLVATIDAMPMRAVERARR